MFYQVLKYLSLALYIWLNSSENITRLFLTVSNRIISLEATLPPSLPPLYLKFSWPARHPVSCPASRICITTSPTLISARLWSILLTMFMTVQKWHLSSSHLTSGPTSPEQINSQRPPRNTSVPTDGWWSSDVDVIIVIITFSSDHQNQQNKIQTFFKPFLCQLASFGRISKRRRWIEFNRQSVSVCFSKRRSFLPTTCTEHWHWHCGHILPVVPCSCLLCFPPNRRTANTTENGINLS